MTRRSVVRFAGGNDVSPREPPFLFRTASHDRTWPLGRVIALRPSAGSHRKGCRCAAPLRGRRAVHPPREANRRLSCARRKGRGSVGETPFPPTKKRAAAGYGRSRGRTGRMGSDQVVADPALAFLPRKGEIHRGGNDVSPADPLPCRGFTAHRLLASRANESPSGHPRPCREETMRCAIAPFLEAITLFLEGIRVVVVAVALPEARAIRCR
jgi:hypothetical protein